MESRAEQLEQTGWPRQLYLRTRGALLGYTIPDKPESFSKKLQHLCRNVPAYSFHCQSDIFVSVNTDVLPGSVLTGFFYQLITNTDEIPAAALCVFHVCVSHFAFAQHCGWNLNYYDLYPNLYILETVFFILAVILKKDLRKCNAKVRFQKRIKSKKHLGLEENAQKTQLYIRHTCINSILYIYINIPPQPSRLDTMAVNLSANHGHAHIPAYHIDFSANRVTSRSHYMFVTWLLSQEVEEGGGVVTGKKAAKPVTAVQDWVSTFAGDLWVDFQPCLCRQKTGSCVCGEQYWSFKPNNDP